MLFETHGLKRGGGKEMSSMMMKIFFVALLCLPVALLAGLLFVRLVDEYIKINREKKEKKERQRLALEHQARRRRGYDR